MMYHNSYENSEGQTELFHTWEYCNLCDHDVLICGACGSNTCIDDVGTVDGKPCEYCDDVYNMYLAAMYDVDG